jgi:hypothetical protein
MLRNLGDFSFRSELHRSQVYSDELKDSTSLRSRRHISSHGRKPVDHSPKMIGARFSGRNNYLSPAKAGSLKLMGRIPRVTLASLAHPGLNSAARYAGSLNLLLLQDTISSLCYHAL